MTTQFEAHLFSLFGYLCGKQSTSFILNGTPITWLLAIGFEMKSQGSPACAIPYCTYGSWTGEQSLIDVMLYPWGTKEEGSLPKFATAESKKCVDYSTPITIPLLLVISFTHNTLKDGISAILEAQVDAELRDLNAQIVYQCKVLLAMHNVPFVCSQISKETTQPT